MNRQPSPNPLLLHGANSTTEETSKFYKISAVDHSNCSYRGPTLGPITKLISDNYFRTAIHRSSNHRDHRDLHLQCAVNVESCHLLQSTMTTIIILLFTTAIVLSLGSSLCAYHMNMSRVHILWTYRDVSHSSIL